MTQDKRMEIARQTILDKYAEKKDWYKPMQKAMIDDLLQLLSQWKSLEKDKCFPKEFLEWYKDIVDCIQIKSHEKIDDFDGVHGQNPDQEPREA